MTVEELKIILRVNGASTYTHSINEVTNVTNNYKNSIGSLTSMLAKLVSAAAITKFTKECIQAASDLQEVANVTNVTFGQSANVVNEWAKKQAANFGLSETSAKRYIGTYGTMAKQFNFTTEQAAKMGVEMTKLTGDVASFYNLDDKASATKLKSVFTGETESLKELGVVMTEANLNNYALEKGFGKTVKDMNEHEKVLLRYSFVMDKLSHTQGDFQRTSDGWANSVRLLKLNLENLKVEIGNQLLPVAGQGLAAINKGLQAISPMLISVAQTIKYYGEAWKNASATTKTFIKIALSAAAILAIAPKIIAMTSAAVKLLTMDIVTLGGALKALLGIVGIVLAVAAMASLTKQVSELKNTSTDIVNVGDSAEISADAVDDLSDALDGLASSAEGLDTFLASFDEVNKVGGSNSLMSNLVNTDDLANIMAAAAGLDDLNGLMDSLSGDIDGLSNELSLFSGNQIFTKEWWEKTKGHVKGWWEYFTTSLKDGTWKDDFLRSLEEVGGWMEENFPEWTNFWEGVGEAIYDLKAKYIDPVAEAIKGLFDKISELAKKFEDTEWSNFWEGVGEFVYDASHPNIITERGAGHHRYAAGGIPNKGSLFIAGESGAELISNFGGSQTRVVNQSQINNNSQPTIAFTPTIMIDGRKISAVVVDDINNTTRSTGNSPLIQMG